jgi:hypothetical protein
MTPTYSTNAAISTQATDIQMAGWSIKATFGFGPIAKRVARSSTQRKRLCTPGCESGGRTIGT